MQHDGNSLNYGLKRVSVLPKSESHLGNLGLNEYITEKYHDEGKVNVYLDGKFADTIDPNMQNFPRLCQITVYRSPALADGVHTLRIVNMSGNYALVDAFRVLERR
jgi:hypothetical protein